MSISSAPTSVSKLHLPLRGMRLLRKMANPETAVGKVQYKPRRVHRPNPPVLVNKVLLEHSRAHSFMNCLWPLSYCEGRLKQLQQRLYRLQIQKYYLDAYRSLPSPSLDYLVVPESKDSPQNNGNMSNGRPQESVEKAPI